MNYFVHYCINSVGVLINVCFDSLDQSGSLPHTSSMAQNGTSAPVPMDTSNNGSTNVDKIDEGLYSRQLYVCCYYTFP